MDRQSTTCYDIGTGKVPEWIPPLPGAQPIPKPTFYNHPVERAGHFYFDIDSLPEEVYDFYRAALTAAGFVVDPDDESPIEAAGGNALGSFSAERAMRWVQINVVQQGSGQPTNVIICYKETFPWPDEDSSPPADF